MDTLLTSHARQRHIQRGIPRFITHCLYAFGSVARSRGADSHFFDRAALDSLADELGERGLRRIERYLNVYAVFGDHARTITVARPKRRRPR